MNYFNYINNTEDLHWMREIISKNPLIYLIQTLDCSNYKQVEEFVVKLVSEIQKGKNNIDLAEIFLLLSELRTNKYFSICIDAMLYCEECPEPLIDYRAFKRFLLNPEDYE